MKNHLKIRLGQIRMYVATVFATLLGYAGLSCGNSCIQCYACVPLGALVCGSLLWKNKKGKSKKLLGAAGKDPDDPLKERFFL